ncbi:AAA family ATPase [Paenibacillus sp. N4]|uniref:AAA family ATPase n=1 Tax=Paenibacillus vietnamensis TaxID=2590547 RepID=UPI001CD13602|nr:AAA family ATPase [Paenibacillus vietnamensis]MCA0757034.1 AAA family ATPase [Paenibacillus vietnamensis]
MTLLYIWLDNYGSFQKQGFQLDSKLRFHYNHDNRELNIQNNDHYIPDFFDLQRRGSMEENGKIANVTGIIGKNGAGKTTLLDFIKEQLVHGAGGIQDKAIVVFQTKNDRVIFHHVDLPIEIGNYKEFGFYLKSYDEFDFSFNLINYSKISSHISYIFFSNIFDAKREIQRGNLMNISTNFLVKQDKLDALETHIRDSNFSETEIFRLAEINRKLNFIHNYKVSDLQLPIKLPSQVTVGVNGIFPTEAVDEKKKSINVLKERVLSFRGKMKVMLSEKNFKTAGIEKVKLAFSHALIDSFLYDLANYRETSIPKSFPKESGIEPQNADWRSLIVRNLEQIRSSFVGEKVANRDLIRWMDGVQEMLDFFDNYINENNIDDGQLLMPLNTNGRSENIMKHLLEKYKKAMGFTPFLNFDWRGLSSGEKAMLGTYARFFRLSDEQERATNLHLQDQVIVLIDEGELYLHPEWQKGFLLSLIEFLPSIYKGRTIQIIITSNSPIVVSDLPAANLILIDKTEKGSRVIDGLVDNKQTFAANIHTLMSDAFFMNTGMIGDFARYKVNQLVNRVMTGTSALLWEDRLELETWINLIGESVLRSKIRHMLQEKLSNQYMYEEANQRLYTLVQKLQNDLEELKKDTRHDQN